MILHEPFEFFHYLMIALAARENLLTSGVNKLEKLKTRLLLVDDDFYIRRDLPNYFSSTEDLVVVGTAANGQEALDKMKSLPCEVILSDLRMPVMGGSELLLEVQKLEHPPIFIAMTGFDTDQAMLDVLASGSVGYIVKSDPPSTILSAVRAAVKGGTALSPSCTSRLVNATVREGKNGKPRHSGQRIEIDLTKSERQVVELLCRGMANLQIAQTLHYSEAGVKKKVSSMFRKFQADSRVGLAMKAGPLVGYPR